MLTSIRLVLLLSTSEALVPLVVPTTSPVLKLNFGTDVAWYPGDRRILDFVTPKQATTIDKAPLVAVVPALGPENDVAALCAVRNVRRIRERIHGCDLECVGRVAVDGATLDDAWFDEIDASPVHALHRLRPHADECARLHDTIRKHPLHAIGPLDLGLPGDPVPEPNLPLDIDRSLFDMARDTLTLIGDLPVAQSRNAYGDVIDFDPEVALLRCVSFAAFRAIRNYSVIAEDKDLRHALASRSTLDRLQHAAAIMRYDIDELNKLQSDRSLAVAVGDLRSSSSFSSESSSSTLDVDFSLQQRL